MSITLRNKRAFSGKEKERGTGGVAPKDKAGSRLSGWCLEGCYGNLTQSETICVSQTEKNKWHKGLGGGRITNNLQRARRQRMHTSARREIAREGEAAPDQTHEFYAQWGGA